MTDSEPTAKTVHIKSARQVKLQYVELLAEYVRGQQELADSATMDRDYLLGLGSIVGNLIATVEILAHATGHAYLGQGEGALVAADSTRIYPAS